MAMISRQEAMDFLFDLAECDLFSEEISNKLQEISQCIRAEDEQGIFIWGAEDDDWSELYVARMNPYQSSAPYNTDELKQEYDAWLKKCSDIYDKYKFKEKIFDEEMDGDGGC